MDAGAQLLAAWHTFLTFALEVGAISVVQQAELWRRVNHAITAALTPQAIHQAHSDPVARFTELLFGLFTSRRAHLSDFHTGQWPGEGWGWEPCELGDARGSSQVHYRPKGYQIGWLDGANLYLEPAATFAELQRFAKDQSEAISVTEATLWKRLYERGLIASREAPHMTVKRSPGGGGRKRVLQLDRSRVEKSGASGASTVADGISSCPTFSADIGQTEKLGHEGTSPRSPAS